jgi:hypothetical protein
MKRRQSEGLPNRTAEKLDELNAETVSRRDSTQVIRRKVENQIQVRSRQRRERDEATSNKWKKSY